MQIFRSFAAATAFATLAACQMGTTTTVNEATPPARTGGDACGANDVGFMAGMRVADVQFDTAERPVRIVGPNSAVTLDHRPERLNVKIDASERITGFSCG